MDWGFWTKKERDFARQFYGSRNIDYEFCYIKISDDEWNKRIQKRNEDIIAGRIDAYFVDEGLAQKFKAIFEEPSPNEQDICGI